MHHEPDNTHPTTPDLATQRRAMLAGVAGLAAGAFLTSRAGAGDLNPPPGPISPTMKPLDQIEPRIAINAQNTPGNTSNVFRITQPGSYYLTGNVQGEFGKNGIEISADNVTVDLMGFTLMGVLGSLRGIFSDSSNITIRNGTVQAWGSDGINLSVNTQPSISVLEHVKAIQNGGAGIQTAIFARVLFCIAEGNTDIGVFAFARSVVSDCVGTSNNRTGIESSGDSILTRCTARSNGQGGIAGGSGSVITECTGQSNTGNGISGGSGTTITQCAAGFNSANGIGVGGNSYVFRNICTNNGTGSNGTAGAGIRTSAFNNRIEENHCTANGRGFQIPNPNNLIIRNTARGNTLNWDITANNKVGSIVNAPNSGAISGNTGGAGVGSTDPWANFTY